MQHHGFSESDFEARETDEYRSLSPLALVTLILGVASVLAVGTPKLWVIPVVAVGSALLALRDLQRNSASRCGRKTVVAGLLLALFFGGFASTRFLADRSIHRRQAQRVAERWFQAIRDSRSAEAYLLLVEPARRATKTGDATSSPTDDETLAGEMDKRFREPPYSTLIAAAPEFEERYVSCEADTQLRQSRVLQLRYDIRWTGQDKRPTALVIDVQLLPGQSPLSRHDRWQVRGVGLARKP